MATDTALRWSIGAASDGATASGIELAASIDIRQRDAVGVRGVPRAGLAGDLRFRQALTLAVPAMILGETALSFLGLCCSTISSATACATPPIPTPEQPVPLRYRHRDAG